MSLTVGGGGGGVSLTSSSSSSFSPEWKLSFDKFCQSTYIDESQLYSDTVCKEVGDRIMHLLKGKPSPLLERDPFYVWVKAKGFALTSYPMLGLKEVLCVPIIDMVSIGIVIIIISVCVC